MNHHQKSHDEVASEDTDNSSGGGGHLGLRSVSFDTISTTTAPTKSNKGFTALTRANLHEKHSESLTTTTSTTTSNSIQHMISLRDFHEEDNLFVGSVVEIHQKHSREKYVTNPEELPEVWTETVSTSHYAGATAAIVQEVGGTTAVEEISRVNPAPEFSSGNSDSFGDTFDTTIDNEQQDNYTNYNEIELVNASPETTDGSTSTPCHLPSIEGVPQKLTSFGSHSSKNQGIVLRYRYELIQDLTGVDWTYNAAGQRDGTDYLMKSILPEVEQEVLGDVLVPTLFDECGRRGLRKLMSTGVIGIDMQPDDFPLPQTGM
jgi:hypothetical protein